MPEGKLLEDLAKKQNCFISSLRDPSEQKRVCGALLQIEPDQYTLDEWDYCISYLVGHKIRFMTVKDAKNFIKQTDRFVNEVQNSNY